MQKFQVVPPAALPWFIYGKRLYMYTEKKL